MMSRSLYLFFGFYTVTITIQCISDKEYVKNFQDSFNALSPIVTDFIASELAVIKEVTDTKPKYNEDIYLNISQLITKYGYDFEEHEVQTEDGYILGLHRIPKKGPVVLIMHGILASSDDFIIAGPDSALGYHLANEGYDVWIGNARGNKYSRKHITMSPNDPKFWDFSWHEIGVHDLPAVIDYILDKTKKKRLNYVGYSQGSTSFYIMCSELPQYNDKVSISIALSPIAFMSHLFTPILRLMFKVNLFSTLISIGQPEFLPYNDLSSIICTDNEIMKFICGNFMLLTFGFNRGETNITNLPVIFGHTPAGCSAKQFEHYKQSLYSGRFRQYDYGAETNLRLYGQKKPPDYKLNLITAPVALFYSFSDWFSSVIDVEILREKLPNVVDYYEVKHFSHIDYLYGKDLKNRVNKRAVKLMKVFHKSNFN